MGADQEQPPPSDELKLMPSQLTKKCTLIYAGILVSVATGLWQTEANAKPTLNQDTRILRTLNISQIRQPINLAGYRISPSTIQLLNQNFNRKVTAIRQIPNLASINEVNKQIAELNNGFVIRSNLAYTVKLGACRTDRGKLKNAGIDCGTRTTLGQSIRLLSDKSSPQYIPNIAKRRTAVNNLRKGRAEVLQDAKKARKKLKDPDVIKALGKAEIKRLSKLSDEQLAQEAITASEQVIEERIFIPKLDSFKGLSKIQNLQGNSMKNLILPQRGRISPGAVQQIIAANRLTAGNIPRTASQEDIFLTGFTLGKEYEWRKRWTKTVKWCWIGCRKKYHVEPYAKFNYGLGLRFPIEAKLKFTGLGDSASVQPTFEAIDANPSQYRQAGLSTSQLFDGQEIVAELGATAGLDMKLPFIGSKTPSHGVDMDFTERLNPPFRGGNFVPPSPGRPLPVMPQLFLRDIDLLGGVADYGVAWAKLHPGIKAELRSNNLTFKLKDNFNNQTFNISSGESRDLTVSNGKSKVTLYNPKYNIEFTITPGVQYNVGVDFGVWGKTWRDEIWIPQLAISLPPGGAEFTCHSNTTCSRTYEFNVAQGSASSSGSNPRNPGPNNGASSGTATECKTGRYLGRYALRSQQTNKFIRAGIGSSSVISAASNRVGGYRSWETFDIYELGNRNGLDGGTYALRSSQDPSRWVSVMNNREKLRLRSGCTTATKSRLFKANRVNSTLQLQSLKNNKWVILRSDNYLYSNAPGLGGNVPRALMFTMSRQSSR